MPVTTPHEFSSEPSLKAEFDPQGRLSRAVFQRDGELMELLVEPSRRAASFAEHTALRTRSAGEMNDWIEASLRRMVDRATRVRRCAFCEKTDAEVEKLIAGPQSYICNECLEVCARIPAE